MSERLAQILDGKALAESIREDVKNRAAALRAAGHPVRLDAILVSSGDNSARVYAENQAKTCRSLGIDYELHELPAGSTFSDIAATVDLLNADPGVPAVMLHMPLPPGVDPYLLQRRIEPGKDVEGVNPVNIGNIVYGRSSLAPCTALATVRLVEHTGLELRGKRVVVIGASDVVGKPIAVLLMRKEATVISANKFTHGLPELAHTADVLIAAAGVPELVTPEWVKPHAVVIDVGINRVTDPETGKTRTVGDVAFENVRRLADWISPVPGGVGPMTVAMLLNNVVEACERSAGE